MEEWEEPLHPGPLPTFYPTLSHDATHISHFLPSADTRTNRAGPNAAWACGIARWEVVGEPVGAALQGPVQIRVLQPGLHDGVHSVRSVCLPSGTRSSG